MLKQLKKRKQEGFTIIEVLIVLAIAGLILLIVFLAVPALQRNSRNTQRKSDVSALLAGINDYAGNSNGGAPAYCTGTTTVDLSTAQQNGTSNAQVKLGYYNKGCAFSATTTAGHVGILQSPASVNALSTTASNDYVNVYLGGTCDPANPGR